MENIKSDTEAWSETEQDSKVYMDEQNQNGKIKNFKSRVNECGTQ
jgi:hypothetical protein